MSAFVDTNILVHHLTGDPPDMAARTTAYLERERELLVTDLVAAKTVYVLSRSTRFPVSDAGDIPACKFGRVIRIQRADADSFLKRAKVKPGELSHLYPPGENGEPPRKR